MSETNSAAGLGYGGEYQRRQIEKYRRRDKNHWRYRIDLADRLFNAFAPKNATMVIDVGCSIGTIAIEYAKKGYDAYGIDFDEAAISSARVLACEEGANPTFVCADVTKLPADFPKAHVALCFDIFEHLHDDQLGALLTALRSRLHPEGVLLFNTFPAAYDYLLYGRAALALPLLPFVWLPQTAFAKLVKIYSLLFDVVLCIATGQTWRERQLNQTHCNLLSAERLRSILQHAGWTVLELKTENTYPLARKWFAKHSAGHRNIVGAAKPIS